ncbi:SRPBCC family protein [Planosporangium mesophilum]|uniref:Polyketide cyclase n=1 Tax=Planosporangium mesophilum TaxID=689768 RepID=A0A8J3WZ27_9ACTN|nr:SRPBCC family protein [Planosporangium mesophilum]GII21802.1 polyketide cyclase [Planosporangium mesophilum]
MARTEHTIGTTPDRVFAVLADGWTYSDWVVGTAHIRAVDRDYPDPGTALHHKVGPWPLAVRDKSVVLDREPDRMLLLRVGLWPIGEGVVRLILTPVGDGATRVTMIEHFPGGPIRWLYTRINDLAMHWRNKESLRRLDDLATRRVPVSH